MIGNRFHCKTENMGITTTFVVVVMLLLFSASCSKEHKEVVDVEFDPDKTYTMKATDVSSLISDSGITRYRLKAKEWQIYGKAAEPHWYFPRGSTWRSSIPYSRQKRVLRRIQPIIMIKRALGADR